MRYFGNVSFFFSAFEAATGQTTEMLIIFPDANVKKGRKGKKLMIEKACVRIACESAGARP